MTDQDHLDDPTTPGANDAQLASLLRGARDHYNVPTRPPAFDAMWTRIEQESFGSVEVPAPARTDVLPLRSRTAVWGRVARNHGAWMGLAAGLLIGAVLGRQSAVAVPGAPVAPVAVTAAVPDSVNAAVDLVTARYLGQTAALLVSLPAEPRTGAMDASFGDRARQLLSTTRLLLDAPAASDPDTRALLEDLELVLAQIVGIQTGNRRAELELINQALEQRELLPRLHSAVNGSSPAAAAGADD